MRTSMELQEMMTILKTQNEEQRLESLLSICHYLYAELQVEIFMLTRVEDVLREQGIFLFPEGGKEQKRHLQNIRFLTEATVILLKAFGKPVDEANSLLASIDEIEKGLKRKEGNNGT